MESSWKFGPVKISHYMVLSLYPGSQVLGRQKWVWNSAVVPLSDIRLSETSAQNAWGKNFQKFTCSNFCSFVFCGSYSHVWSWVTKITKIWTSWKFSAIRYPHEHVIGESGGTWFSLSSQTISHPPEKCRNFCFRCVSTGMTFWNLWWAGSPLLGRMLLLTKLQRQKREQKLLLWSKCRQKFKVLGLTFLEGERWAGLID